MTVPRCLAKGSSLPPNIMIAAAPPPPMMAAHERAERPDFEGAGGAGVSCPGIGLIGLGVTGFGVGCPGVTEHCFCTASQDPPEREQSAGRVSHVPSEAFHAPPAAAQSFCCCTKSAYGVHVNVDAFHLPP